MKNTKDNPNTLHPYRRKVKITPSNISCDIADRITLLENILITAQREVERYPQGTLYVFDGSSENGHRYYLVENGVKQYIPKSKRSLAVGLANRKYYETLIKNIEKEKKILERASKALEDSLVHADSLIGTYKKLGRGVMKHVKNPIIVDDEAYVENWYRAKYKGKSFDSDDKTEHYSEKGERMRSKSELLIANALYHAGIPYRYEMPVKLKSGRIVYPDFTILKISERRVYYLEHLGKMDSIDYIETTLLKLGEYKNSDIVLGKNLLVTYETKDAPVKTRDIQQLINILL